MGTLEDKENERKLTEKEARRGERFERLKSQMAEQGYEHHDMTIGLMYANIMSLVVMLPLCFVLGLAFLVANPSFTVSLGGPSGLVLIVILVALIVAHEGIHGLTWGIFAPHHWRDVEFGFIPKYLTPYCTCGEPMRRWCYVLGCLMPLIVLGILPAIWAIVTGDFVVLGIALLMIIAAGGDVLIAIKVLRYRTERTETLWLDHPYKAGSVVFER